METVVICLFLTAGLLMVIIGLAALIDSFSNDGWIRDNAEQMDFKHFLVLYKIAPDKWRLYSSYVTYAERPYSLGVEQDYYFRIFDKLRYKRWKKAKDKAAEKARQMRRKKAVTEAMLKDIEAWKKRNGVEISTTNAIKDATERPKISLMEEALGWKSDC